MKFYTSNCSTRTCFNFLFCKCCIWARNYQSWRGSSMQAFRRGKLSLLIINVTLHLISHCLKALNNFAVTFWSFGWIFVIFIKISEFVEWAGHQESVVLVSRFFAFSCVLKFYEMQKLEMQFFFSSTSKNNNYVFSIYQLVFILGIRVYCYIYVLI